MLVPKAGGFCRLLQLKSPCCLTHSKDIQFKAFSCCKTSPRDLYNIKVLKFLKSLLADLKLEYGGEFMRSRTVAHYPAHSIKKKKKRWFEYYNDD